MEKDIEEKASELDFNLKSYLADAYLHPIFHSFEEVELVEVKVNEVRVDKNQTCYRALHKVNLLLLTHPIMPSHEDPPHAIQHYEVEPPTNAYHYEVEPHGNAYRYEVDHASNADHYEQAGNVYRYNSESPNHYHY